MEGSRNSAGQTVFVPGGAVTCAEAAVIIDRLLATGDVAAASSALSAETAPAWAYQSAVNMEAVSVLSGGADLSGTLSRGEAAEMLSAMLDVLDISLGKLHSRYCFIYLPGQPFPHST